MSFKSLVALGHSHLTEGSHAQVNATIRALVVCMVFLSSRTIRGKLLLIDGLKAAEAPINCRQLLGGLDMHRFA